jgi:hypothetical protein
MDILEEGFFIAREEKSPGVLIEENAFMSHRCWK